MAAALVHYQSLREDLGQPELAILQVQVRTHFDSLVRAQQRNELVAVDLAELLCIRLEGLLAAAGSFTSDARASVVGAARYFISAQDAVPDDRACTGLDDDVAVFNHVAASLGRADLEITG